MSSSKAKTLKRKCSVEHTPPNPGLTPDHIIMLREESEGFDWEAVENDLGSAKEHLKEVQAILDGLKKPVCVSWLSFCLALYLTVFWHSEI
jgi:hypothetical protein